MSAVKKGRVTKTKAKQSSRRKSTRRSLTGKANDDQNKDPKPLPLVERTNSLPIEEFISLYINPELLDYDFLWRPKDKYCPYDRNKSHIKMHCTVDVYSSSTIPAEVFDVCFRLIEQTSADAYRASSSGWSAARKRKEMRLPDMKYLIQRRSRTGSPEVTFADGISFQRGEILAFLSFMVTYEDGKEVIYCYEVHVAPKAQGQGIGMRLMTLLRSIGVKIGLEKSMLTCFRSNHRALRFYKSIGYEVDENSPRSIRLRTGEVEPDYYIMSESLKQKSSNENDAV
jgi:ribosomal protein S18 acetylase RimI-like enzyme